jgi:hypothetical protein
LQTFVGPEQEVRAFRDVVFPRLRAEGYLVVTSLFPASIRS